MKLYLLGALFMLLAFVEPAHAATALCTQLARELNQRASQIVMLEGQHPGRAGTTAAPIDVSHMKHSHSDAQRLTARLLSDYRTTYAPRVAECGWAAPMPATVDDIRAISRMLVGGLK